MINEFRNMKEHGGRTTSQQHLVPLVLNQKPPDDEEELWGCLGPTSCTLKNSLAVAGFVPHLFGRSITLHRIAEVLGAVPKHPDSLSFVEPPRVCPPSARIHIFTVQELQ